MDPFPPSKICKFNNVYISKVTQRTGARGTVHTDNIIPCYTNDQVCIDFKDGKRFTSMDGYGILKQTNETGNSINLTLKPDSSNCKSDTDTNINLCNYRGTRFIYNGDDDLKSSSALVFGCNGENKDVCNNIRSKKFTINGAAIENITESSNNDSINLTLNTDNCPSEE